MNVTFAVGTCSGRRSASSSEIAAPEMLPCQLLMSMRGMYERGLTQRVSSKNDVLRPELGHGLLHSLQHGVRRSVLR